MTDVEAYLFQQREIRKKIMIKLSHFVALQVQIAQFTFKCTWMHHEAPDIVLCNSSTDSQERTEAVWT